MNPQLIVDDFGQRWTKEIVVGICHIAPVQPLIYLDDGSIARQQAISRRITSLARVPFGPTGTAIAVGTNFGQVISHAPSGELLWYRTLNRPITALAAVELPTNRRWPSARPRAVSRPIPSRDGGYGPTTWPATPTGACWLLLPAAAPPGQTPGDHSGPLATASELADVLLLGNNGQTLAKLNDTDLPGLTRLVDVNNDNH